MTPPNYNHYSQHAKRSLMKSHFSARQYGHTEVDTDHLFLGILGTDRCLGWQVLNDMGVSLSQTEYEVRTLHEVLHPDYDRLPFTNALREALIMAVTEAQALGSHYIGTEHTLLGLVRSGGGQLRELMSRLEITSEQVRGRVRRLLQQGISEITMEAVRRMAKLSELGKRALNAAEQVASSYQQQSITPEHLLYVLTQERRSIAKRVLAECECNVAQLEADIAQMPAYSIEAEVKLDRILDRAVDRAEAMGSHYTGTEHILLAMISTADHLLEKYGIDINQLESLLDSR